MFKTVISALIVLFSATASFACDDLPGYPEDVELTVNVERDADGLMVELPSYVTIVRDADGLPMEL